jgi:hypothetical protein
MYRENANYFSSDGRSIETQPKRNLPDYKSQNKLELVHTFHILTNFIRLDLSPACKRREFSILSCCEWVTNSVEKF